MERCEVASILVSYATALRRNPADFGRAAYTRDRSYYPAGFDFKGTDALYEVDGQWLRADEFGNFAAGYAGARAFGLYGYMAMAAGGVLFAIGSTEEHWLDGDSRPMINAGARRGMQDRWSEMGSWGRSSEDGGSRQLTSRAGCQ